MNFGVVLQTNPPAARVIELARRAETHGFTNMWAFDSHLLWEEPFVIFSRILDATHKLTLLRFRLAKGANQRVVSLRRSLTRTRV